MSIIDDTLSRLGRPGAADAVTLPPSDVLAPLTLEGNAARRRSSLPKSALLGVALIGASLAAWWWVEQAAFSPLLPTPAASAPIAAAPAGAATPEAPPAPTPPAAATGDGADAAAKAVPGTAEPGKSPAVPAPGANTPMVSPAVAAATAPLPAATLAQAKAEMPAAAVPAKSPTDFVLPKPKKLPPSFRQAVELADQGKTEAALAAWRTGLETLAPKQRLELLASFSSAGGALAAVTRLNDLDGVFVVEDVRKGKPLWRLGVLSSPAHRAWDIELASSRLGRADFSSVSAGRLLAAKGKLDAANAGANGGTGAGTPVLTNSHPGVRVAAGSGNESVPSGPAQPREAAAHGDEAGFDPLLDGVVRAVGRNAFSEAARQAQGLRQQYPGRVESWLWSGRAELGNGAFAAAEGFLAKAVEMAPHLADAWLLRGIATQELGNDRQALAYFAEAERLRPRDPDIQFNVAYSAARLGELGRARDAFSTFLGLTAKEPRYDAQRRHAERWLQGQR